MPSSPARPRSPRQATGVLTIAAVGIVLLVTTTASAQTAPRPRPTTTTTRPSTTTSSSTTTTAAPTTTTSSSTTTSSTTTTTTAPTTTTSSTTTTTTAPTTTTSEGAPPTACGAGITKPDGTPWDCTFVDDFDGTTLDRTKWVPQQTSGSGFTSGTECFVDTPDNVSVSDGALHLTARKEAAPFTCTDPNGDFTTQYTSGSVSTNGLFSQTGGRFEVRAKFPPAIVKGLQESLWLWPDDPLKYGPWPTSGEIDIAEAYSLYPDRVIPYIHYVPATWDFNVTNDFCLVNDISAYHTYTAVWTTDSITITFDGQTCLVDVWDPAAPLVKPQPFDHPFMVALTQALGQTANSFDPLLTPLPATTDVDYVHVWK